MLGKHGPIQGESGRARQERKNEAKSEVASGLSVIKGSFQKEIKDLTAGAKSKKGGRGRQRA